MLGLSSLHKKENIVSVADIGSGHVGYALVEVRKGQIPVILASARAVLPLEKRTPAQVKSGILSLLDDICKKASEEYVQIHARQSLPLVSASYVILQAPWSESEIAHAETVFKKDTHITDEIIAGLAQEALKTDEKLDHNNLFEAGVVRVSLNGYPTKKPAGKEAHAVAVSALISQCEPKLLANIKEKLQRVFPSAKPSAYSRVRVLLSALREMRPQSSDSMIIDMENEATNCIVMRDGLISEHFLVPEGTQTILKRISEGMPEETLSLMRMVSRGTCSTPACDKLNSSLALAEPEIVRIFGDALGHLVSKHRLPNELLLISDPALSDWLSTIFSRIDFSQFTVTTREFAPSVITSENLRASVASAGGAIDTGLMLAVSFVNTEERN
ncbi:MAG: hypothetical protein NUV88_01855 [Candidatus Kaiserbacteria bacterium]|nr:hypothetical protein [Candidatus Kaiserbacteria bacterium]